MCVLCCFCRMSAIFPDVKQPSKEEQRDQAHQFRRDWFEQRRRKWILWRLSGRESDRPRASRSSGHKAFARDAAKETGLTYQQRKNLRVQLRWKWLSSDVMQEYHSMSTDNLRSKSPYVDVVCDAEWEIVHLDEA